MHIVYIDEAGGVRVDKGQPYVIAECLSSCHGNWLQLWPRESLGSSLRCTAIHMDC